LIWGEPFVFVIGGTKTEKKNTKSNRSNEFAGCLIAAIFLMLIGTVAAYLPFPFIPFSFQVLYLCFRGLLRHLFICIAFFGQFHYC